MQFNIGDRLVCVDGRVRWQTGMECQVISITRDDFLEVLFLNGRENILKPSRFVYADPTFNNLSPVERKIRQMEKRFKTWQERKVNAMV